MNFVLIFVFWYNIDFVICGSLKCMRMIVVFFFNREKPYFEGVGDPQKIKHLFQGLCRLSKFLFQGSYRPPKFLF